MTTLAVANSKSIDHSTEILQSIWNVVGELKLQVGDQLPSIRELADRLDVKPTAVRDALLHAQSKGLVKVAPRAGAFLRTTSPLPWPKAPASEDAVSSAISTASVSDDHNLLHLLDARRLIEVELVGRAAERRRIEDLLPVRRPLEAMLQLPDDATRAEYVPFDVRFHVEIARLAGNQVLFNMQRWLMELLRPHLCESPFDLQRRQTTDRSHVAVYESLVAGDADKARSEMRGHLSLAYDGFLRDIQESPARGELNHR